MYDLLFGLASSGIGGLLGLSGGGPRVDRGAINNAINTSREGLDFVKNNFGNANSQFYQGAMKNYFQGLNNTYGGWANTAGQLNRATGGSASSSNSILAALRNGMQAKATDASKSFATNLYTQGMQMIPQAYNNLANTYMGVNQAIMGAPNVNANQQQFGGQMMNLGMVGLGKYFDLFD